MAPPERPQFFEKKSDVTETPVNKTPEQLQQETEELKRETERAQLAKTDTDSQKYYADAKAPQVMPGGMVHSHEADRLVFVGIDAADASYEDMLGQAEKSGITPESRQKIAGLYSNLAQGFETKIQSLQNDPANIKDPKKFQKELFEAQKQFEKDLFQVAKETNGIINAPGAKKKTEDAEQAKNDASIQQKERMRFSDIMKDMLAQESRLKMAEERNARVLQETSGAKMAAADLESYVGKTATTVVASAK